MRSTTTDAASAYMGNLGRYPVMNADDFDTLIHSAKDGDTEAKNRIIKGNLRFVVQIAAEYQTSALPFADLLAEGNVGLIKAVDKFDPSLGYRFSTYAVWWIRNAIQRAIRQQSHPFRLPHNRFDDLSRLQTGADRLSQETGRAVSPEEVADALEMNSKRMELALRAQTSAVSLDGQATDGERSLHNILPNGDLLQDELMLQDEIAEKLEKAIQNLEARDAEIIRLTFGLNEAPLTLTQVGSRFGISKERVRQLRNRAMNQLKMLLLGDEGLKAEYI